MNRRGSEVRGLNKFFEGRGYSVKSVVDRPEGTVADLLSGSKELCAEDYARLAAELDLTNRDPEEIRAIIGMCESRLSDGFVVQHHVGVRRTHVPHGTQNEEWHRRDRHRFRHEN